MDQVVTKNVTRGKNFWSLKISGKVKHFVWKVLRGVLPCLGTLVGRHIPTSAQCPNCRIGFEDSQRCLFTCKRALKVWIQLGLKEEILKAVGEVRSGAITMDILMRGRSPIGELPMAELIAVASWYIWWQRRQFVKGEEIRPPECTAVSIKVVATNFVCAYTPNRPVQKRDHRCVGNMP